MKMMVTGCTAVGGDDDEIRDAIFSMGDNRALGPDRYSTAFFKEAWDIIASDITSPMRINDYRLISCCNVLYKCISRIISNRMKDSLSSLVSLNQSAFVPGRCISDNILLTQELMHNYHLDRSTPTCAFKVDIQKAYDIVDWKFLKDVLIGFGFHPCMIGWIMECGTSISFSLNINGNLHGYFKGNRGLRQGGPMSLYLFTLVMEVLTLMLHWRARDSIFTYQYCSKLNIINLCFADDLFLFAHGDVKCARVIMNTLEEFKNSSRLTPSLPKSTALMLELEQLMRGFLWCQGEMRRGKAKVAWEDVCLPRKESGLGIRQLEGDSDFSVAKVWDCIRPRVNECPLCGTQPDSHDIPYDLNYIVDFLIPLAKMRLARSVISKLVFAASSYFIRKKRNNRLFMKTSRSRDQVINIIMSTVRLKLLTCKFKKTKNVEKIIHLWKLPTSLISSSSK
nr:hypothetical protein [Tanacetum cinerariifolium]